ncbi:hypothetical protein K470DRAFT_271729 [Piedraia hortae CBS 480.64]|uniref:DASH complex subunit DAD1 n=1 Tax=Piedraia hortae CBS 480.64 TaxID=1314780 RepID=A0A6A7BX53_9PEZI|nr:hypothetical protein K470DRAFT_271729 [Piedraia hortae CBS 480.64]
MDGESFEHQRALLLEDVARSMDNVLQNLNKLNLSLEGIIAVGNEFGQVESLWSQFESVMAEREQDQNGEGSGEQEQEQKGGGEKDDQ